MSTQLFISEGGAHGHMNHIYDNRYLTFAKVKEILSAASSGQLEGTEKTDGFNIFVGYKDGKARAARNKTDIKKGGMDAIDLANREFAGGESIKNTYVNAFKTFERGVNSLTPEERWEIFGRDGNIFYNAEIQGPAASNVVNYDTNYLTIHQRGHSAFDLTTGRRLDVNVDKNVAKLSAVIDKMQKAVEGEKFAVHMNAIRKLKSLDDDKALNLAVNRIDKATSAYGISDNNTIEDFLRAKLLFLVADAHPELGEEYHKLIVERILGNDTLMGKGIERKARIELMKFIKANEAKFLLNAIFPIEMAIHDFAVEMLKGVESAFILDNNAEIKRLKNELSVAIKTIQSSGNEEAMEVLSKHLEKIKHIDNVSSAAEGFVFQYDGQVYKFTGNFAPANQILGLFKFGRGNIPPLRKPEPEKIEELPAVEEEVLDENEDGKTIAVVPGGFKPPHGGHYGLAKYFSDLPDVDMVMVLISPKVRTGHSLENRVVIDASMSMQLWQLYTKRDSKIKVSMSPHNSPIRASYDYMEKLNSGDTLIMGMGEKEISAGDTRFAKAPEYGAKFGIEVDIVPTPMFEGGISGTRMRELIAAGEKEEFQKYLPKHLDTSESEQAWNIVAGSQKKISSKLGESSQLSSYIYGIIEESIKRRLLESEHAGESPSEGESDPNMRWADALNVKHKKMSDLDTWKERFEATKARLEEISAMGAGSVEGGGIGGKKKKLDMLIREEGVKLISLQGGLGISREKLPQIRSFHVNDFRKWAKTEGVDSIERKVKVSDLKPIQNAVNVNRINKLKKSSSPEEIASKAVMVSQDNYLIDGHHRWYALKQLKSDTQLSAIVLQVSIVEALRIMKRYPKTQFGSIKDVGEHVVQEVVDYLIERYSKVFNFELNEERDLNETGK